jgi:peptidoglycan/xylan/chitin deacetylase (PgdA/CDA1 family)
MGSCKWYRPGVVVEGVEQRCITLTFHGVGSSMRDLEPSEADVWMSRDGFLRVLDSAAGRDDVRITFDDGNSSDVELALAALRERGLFATFFVVAGRIGTPGFLDAPAIRELAAAGMVIGSHGMRHRRWAGLGEPSLREELVDARTLIEEITRRPVTEAACPFGAYDRRALMALRDSGYHRVYTSDRGTARPGEFLQARNTVEPRDGKDLLERIAATEAALLRAWARRVKLAVKRWR